MRRRRAAALSACALAGLATECGGPLGPIAGGRLAGRVVDTAPSEPAARGHRTAQVEVRPTRPYSVNVNYYLVRGRIYLDIGERAGWHRWRRYIREDPRVRLRLGETIYKLQAVPVTDAGEVAAVLPAFYEKDRMSPPPGCAAPVRVPDCVPRGVGFVRLDARPVQPARLP